MQGNAAIAAAFFSRSNIPRSSSNSIKRIRRCNALPKVHHLVVKTRSGDSDKKSDAVSRPDTIRQFQFPE
jgi:hypothetical protein